MKAVLLFSFLTFFSISSTSLEKSGCNCKRECASAEFHEEKAQFHNQMAECINEGKKHRECKKEIKKGCGCHMKDKGPHRKSKGKKCGQAS